MAEVKQAAPNQWAVSRDVEEESEHWTEAIVGAEPDLPDPESKSAPTMLGVMRSRLHPSKESMVASMRALREELVEAWDQAEANRKRIEVMHQIGRMSDDEVRVVELLVRKLMFEGRDEYGPLDLSTDKRTAKDFERECNDELADALTYALMRELREQE